MYLHELAADENGRSFAAVVNRKLGLGVVIDFDASLLPYFMEWKSTGAGDYVVGLEPSNSSVHGRGWTSCRPTSTWSSPMPASNGCRTIRI